VTACTPSSPIRSTAEGPDVAELIARLEGIPFAIELAAARMRLLTVPEINARLKDRFKLLSGGGRAALGRQQTLRTLIDWSYELLQDEERVLLRRLCVSPTASIWMLPSAFAASIRLPPTIPSICFRRSWTNRS
jgi:hypothetical protein